MDRAVAGGAALSIAAFRKLGRLQAPSVTQTPFGGAVTTWSEVASVWLDLTIPRTRSGGGPAETPVTTDVREAVCRDHADAAQGQRLVVDGDRWRVVRLVRDAPKMGLMTLHLEKD
ncbi:phage head completion protein [Caulobacter sp. NIBR2454]|uniref:phage head completion protein n=1 Tax=Caulobacter sp. NIBR2454 TaxID=3015996 RepID=UPI0022B648B2|nr:head-tail adaptor protein [Caulobacter sp. NIBR2454]